MKNTKTVRLTNAMIMREAHKRARTYIGDYDACFKLAMIEIHREGVTLSETPLIVDYSNVKPATIKLVNDYLNHKFSNGKTRYSAEKSNELRTLIFDGSDDKGTIANTLFHASKGFKSTAKRFTKDDVYFNADDVYMSGIEKLLSKVEKGERIDSLSSAFKFEVLNIVKKEDRRMKKNDYTSMNAENFRESSLYTNYDNTEYRQIPVERIILKHDMFEIFSTEQLEIIDLLLDGKKKVEIDKHFGQRMDRKYQSMSESLYAYVKHSYSV